MNSPYLHIDEAAALGRYLDQDGKPSAEVLRRDMERGTFIKGRDYFNRGGKKKGAILFYRENFIAALEGREILNPEDFAKKKK